MQTFSNAVIVGGYYLNTNEYAKNCINKQNTWMHCNGKCQLLKKLNQEERQENQAQKAASAEVISSKSFFCAVPEPAPALHSVIVIPRNDNRLQQMPRSLLRPPCC